MWIMIPQSLMHDDDLTSTARYIFGLFVNLAGSYLSDFEISETLNISERAVRRNIETLEKKGLVERVNTESGDVFIPDFTGFPLNYPQKKLITFSAGEISDNGSGTELAFSTSTSTPSTDEQSKVYFCSDEQKHNKSKAINDAVRNVFEYWNTRRMETLAARNVSSRKAKLTAKRRSTVKSRLSAGRTEEEIKKAIDGCMSSDYHVENGYIDLTLICANDEKLDRFIIRHEQKQNREEVGPTLRVLNE